MPDDNDLRRETEISRLLAELHMDEGVLVAVRDRNSAADAPYHSYQHLLSVALNAVDAARSLRVPRPDQVILIVAALFHDVDHSAGLHKADSYNIGLALGAFYRYSRRPDAGLNTEQKLTVNSLIRATEFPHPLPRTLLEQIIQDADILQALEPDGARFLRGLSTETGRRTTNEQSNAFLTSVHLNTEWGRSRLSAHLCSAAA